MNKINALKGLLLLLLLLLLQLVLGWNPDWFCKLLVFLNLQGTIDIVQRFITSCLHLVFLVAMIEQFLLSVGMMFTISKLIFDDSLTSNPGSLHDEATIWPPRWPFADHDSYEWFKEAANWDLTLFPNHRFSILQRAETNKTTKRELER